MIGSPTYWQQACDYLSEVDGVMAGIIEQYIGEAMQKRGDPFQTLARSIVGQQISVKAADSVWQRLELALSAVSPQALLQLTEEQMRACGLSQQKCRYLVNVASFCQSCDWQELQKNDEEYMRAQLMSIKGVGPWTWEMFAIFYLQLPDILPLGDVGLINACRKSYGLETKEDITKHAQQWHPYRTVATWFLWRSLDPVAVSY